MRAFIARIAISLSEYLTNPHPAERIEEKQQQQEYRNTMALDLCRQTSQVMKHNSTRTDDLMDSRVDNVYIDHISNLKTKIRRYLVCCKCFEEMNNNNFKIKHLVSSQIERKIKLY